uniref:Vesicle transport protein USE1 n=2 Tax=Drosophila melanogaster TaxID=7227 RepID=USE1_DROME|nr:unconventional SNARE in the ER 1 [Drosophila melanogaster]Q9VSU7.3 RecName: Full=Vesicle transport protein USE1; AltName: Full=USE1-like protein [Drosophila melanogaster]AAF50314.3 unconventional SNARE in the ER 1 [Drosophila melanogaster]|eukprot:NP_648289.2 unconventional SNARE in the ER 1 [Drosophila melanogaster]
MATKLNVNIRTLLANCEELAKSEQNFWRLQKFIKSLDTMLAELEAMGDPQSVKRIPGYLERLQALKISTGYADVPGSTTKTPSQSSAVSETGENALKEIRQLQNSKYHNELRKELLQDSDALRRRRGADESSSSSGSANVQETSGENMNQAAKYYTNAQEKITEHMLSLTRNLKEQTETANRIIRRDTEVVSRSAGMADRNINSLGKEAEKLEQHSKKAYKCWLWLMIAFVIATFIGMVLFMKIMKKKKS